MMNQDATTNVQQLKDLVAEFVKERDWDHHHNPKNLAITIALEAAELMEHFQWESDYQSNDKAEWSNELGDIVYSCLLFAIVADIDISASVKKMLQKAAKKYPVEKYGQGRKSSGHYQKMKFKSPDKHE